MDASVRKRSRSVGLASDVTFYVSYYKSVNSHRDRAGPGRETQNCRHFWTRLGSSRRKGVNSHRDRAGPGRETQNCRHFWTRLRFSRLKKCQQSQGSGGSWSRNAELSSLLDSSQVFAFQKVSTVTGIGRVLVAKRRTVVTFGLVSGFRISKSVNSHRDRAGPGRETQNCRHFWTRLRSSRFKKCQQSQGSGGSWSRNAELSSLLDSSQVFASQKVSTVTGIGRVLVAKRRTVVTFGLVSGFRVSKSVNSHRDRAGPGRETQNCRHFWTRLRFSRFKKCQQSQGSGGSWSRNAELSSLLDSSQVFASQKVSTVTGIGRVLVAKRRTVVTFGLVSGFRVSKSVNSHRDRAGPGRETQNCRHFWTRLGSSRFKSVNSHRDRAGPGRETQIQVF